MANPPELKTLARKKQLLLDQLLEQNSNDQISDQDKQKLEVLVAEAERLMADNARLLVDYADKENSGCSVGAIPVTVWVKPSSTAQ